MKIIVRNSITEISATSEATNFPASNLLNDSIIKGWKAANSGVTAATLTVKTRGITGGFGLVGIVAETVHVEVSGRSGISWQNVNWQNINWGGDAGTVAISEQLIRYSKDVEAQLWVDFAEIESPVEITITLLKSNTNPFWLKAGVLVVGQVFSFPDPKAGFEEGLDDKSIYRELSNGAEWSLDRPRLRTFSALIDMERDGYFYLFMRNIAKRFGRRPMMISLTDKMVNEWVLYGRFVGMPTGSHYHRTRSSLQVAFKEVV